MDSIFSHWGTYVLLIALIVAVFFCLGAYLLHEEQDGTISAYHSAIGANQSQIEYLRGAATEDRSNARKALDQIASIRQACNNRVNEIKADLHNAKAELGDRILALRARLDRANARGDKHFSNLIKKQKAIRHAHGLVVALRTSPAIGKLKGEHLENALANISEIEAVLQNALASTGETPKFTARTEGIKQALGRVFRGDSLADGRTKTCWADGNAGSSTGVSLHREGGATIIGPFATVEAAHQFMSGVKTDAELRDHVRQVARDEAKSPNGTYAS